MDKEFKEESIKKLREIEELIIKEQDELENIISLEVASAKENSYSNQEVAIAAWKRKKLYQNQLLEVDSTLTRVELLRELLSSGGEGDAWSDGYGAASSESRQRSLKDIDAEVTDTIRDVSKQLDKWRENTAAISNNTAHSNFDVEELKKELEDLHVESWTGLPVESSKDANKSNLDDEEEFAKLQAWAE